MRSPRRMEPTPIMTYPDNFHGHFNNIAASLWIRLWRTFKMNEIHNFLGGTSFFIHVCARATGMTSRKLQLFCGLKGWDQLAEKWLGCKIWTLRNHPFHDIFSRYADQYERKKTRTKTVAATDSQGKKHQDFTMTWPFQKTSGYPNHVMAVSSPMG